MGRPRKITSGIVKLTWLGENSPVREFTSDTLIVWLLVRGYNSQTRAVKSFLLRALSTLENLKKELTVINHQFKTEKQKACKYFR